MKTKIALSMLLAVALLPACTTTRTASTNSDYKSARYASTDAAEPAPPAEGPEADVPAEGPPNIAANPAYVPTPLLRTSAAASP